MASQYGQDLWALEMLGGLRGGFFLDSGAADGVSSSNTLLLERAYGWQGICVEPNRAMYASLKRNRGCHTINCCLYDRDGSVEFLENARMMGGILEEYDPAVLRYAHRIMELPHDPEGKPATVAKEARTVRSVLEQFQAPRIFDFWSLDTEGSELAILKSFPFDEYTFRVLTVEHNRGPAQERIREFLEGRGYRRMRSLVIDDCYVRPDLVPRPVQRSHVWSRIGRGRLAAR